MAGTRRTATALEPLLPSRAPRWRAHVVAGGVYVLLAIAFSWPLPAHLQTRLTGAPDSDTGVYVWNLWVFKDEVLEHRTLPYFTDRIFRASGRTNLSLHNYTAFANLIALPFVRPLGKIGGDVQPRVPRDDGLLGLRDVPARAQVLQRRSVDLAGSPAPPSVGRRCS